jgi:hypothetical protein
MLTRRGILFYNTCVLPSALLRKLQISQKKIFVGTFCISVFIVATLKVPFSKNTGPRWVYLHAIFAEWLFLEKYCSCVRSAKFLICHSDKDKPKCLRNKTKQYYYFVIKVTAWYACAGTGEGGGTAPTHSQRLHQKEVGDQHHAAPALPLAKTRLSVIHKAGWAFGMVRAGTEILASVDIRSPYLLVRSESLYWLTYPDRHYFDVMKNMFYFRNREVPNCGALIESS